MLFKNYRFFLFALLLLLASCRGGLQLGGGNQTDEDKEQQVLAKEFKKEEKKAARQARKAIWRAEMVAKRGQNKRIEKVIYAARSYRGTPYRFGGTTRIGIDCSGLLCQSFSTINVKLPRNSTDQSRFGPTVREKDLRKGDLVFFGATKGSNAITHVGMVTEVKKRKEEVTFIHASTSLGVIEDNLYGNYWKHLFIKAVRPKI